MLLIHFYLRRDKSLRVVVTSMHCELVYAHDDGRLTDKIVDAEFGQNGQD